MPYKDKTAQQKCSKAHYETNRAEYIHRASAHKEKSRKAATEFINSYLADHPCVDCGEPDIIVLEFDHVSGEKLGAISNSGRAGWSIETIKKEIEKCEVRCANCHRRVTHARRK